MLPQAGHKPSTSGRSRNPPLSVAASATTNKSLRFRHGSSARYDSDFAPNQKWVSLSGRICSDFVDETSELNEIYSSGPFESDAASSPNRTIESPASSLGALTLAAEALTSLESASWSPRPLYTPTHSPSSAKRRCTNDSVYSFSSARQALENHAICASPNNDVLSTGDFSQEASIEQPHQASLLPNQNLSHVTLQEACLMRYFVDNLACWFDLADPDRHFALVVPQRARHCPALLLSIYTASSRHLCRLSRYLNPTTKRVEYLGKTLPDLHIDTAVEYHSRCIEYLVNSSNDPEAIFDVDLLTASIILRFYEEVDAPFNGGDWEASLRGARVFIDAQASSHRPSSPEAHESPIISSLRCAAFRVACRQEVYISFTKQRPPFPLSSASCQTQVYRLLDPCDDYIWSHRAVVHCSDVLTFCYGPLSQTASSYDILLQYHQEWTRLRPNSFDPIWESQADAGAFDELWFLSDCHVTGVQHWNLAEILLTVYDPRIPRLGPNQKSAAHRIEKQVMAIVKKLCGIAISNRRAPPAMITACIAIAMCGDQFTELREQQALLEVLRETDVEYAWPTGHIQARLRAEWGW